jgi:hypothetical protein
MIAESPEFAAGWQGILKCDPRGFALFGWWEPFSAPPFRASFFIWRFGFCCRKNRWNRGFGGRQRETFFMIREELIQKSKVLVKYSNRLLLYL